MKRPLPTDFYGQRVGVYRNLTDKCLSIAHKKDPVKHAMSVALKDIEFRVQEGGYETYVRDGFKSKNVHAFAVGVLLQCSEEDWGIEPICERQVEINYNPKLGNYFYERQSGFAVTRAKSCIITPSGVLAYL